MGPLVPDIISQEFNYLVALIVGVGFGFALEQAGFSSTRKLVGLFYGYDFTVLKVFFTAGVTAMVGVLLFTHLGWLNIEYVFVNPFFVKSAIIGGLIMGVGFIIGGFCPGTSVCAAAVGKVDAMAFIGGAFLGILAFMEAYPLLENMYKANDMGPVVIADAFGVSRTTWAIILSVIAVAAFWITTRIEQKVNGEKGDWSWLTIKRPVVYSMIPVLIIVIIIITPSRDEYVMSRLEARAAAGDCLPRIIDADKLAYELINNYYAYNIIDIRSEAEYDSFQIVSAINIPLDKLANLEYRPLFNQRIKTNVFYGSNAEDAKRACLLARFHGDNNGLALKETAEEFQGMFFSPEPLDENPSRSEVTVRLFREDAARKMEEIQTAVSNLSQPVERKVRVVQGGCS